MNMLIGFAIGFSIATFLGCCKIADFQAQAVEHGAARWSYDQHGNRQWAWKEISYE